MTRLAALLIFLYGCSVFTAQPAAPEMPPPPVSAVARALDATVALTKEGRTYCAGVWVNGLILTANHCVDDKLAPMSVELQLRDGRAFAGLVVYYDKDTDIAVLSPTSIVAHVDAPLAPTAPLLGDPVVVIGHPRGYRWFITTGVANGLHHSEAFGSTYFMVSAPVFFGNSGGPVYNQHAEVIGITSFMGGAPHLAGAVPLDTIREALEGRSALVR